MRRIRNAVLVAVVLMTMGIASVGATHVNNPNVDMLTLTCDGVDFDVVAGPGAAAHVVGTGQTFVGLEFTHQLLADDVVIFEDSFSSGMKKGLQDRLTTCTNDNPIPAEVIPLIEAEFGVDIEEGATVVFRLTVRGLLTPAG